MATVVEQLVGELTSLRQREGVRSPRRSKRLGPQLRRALAIVDGDRHDRIVARLAASIRQHLGEQEVALLAALALHPAARQVSLEHRLRALAKLLHVSERTARRRVDEAIALYAERLAAAGQAGSATDDAGYSVDAHEARLAFTGRRLKAVEWTNLRVVAEERLSAVRFRFAVPLPSDGSEPELNLVLLHGAERCYGIHRQGRMVECWIELPHPLMPGDPHDLGVRLELPDGQPLDPHYVVQPATPYGTVDVAVRFDLTELPAEVWRVDGAMPGAVDFRPPDADLLPLESGEVGAAFRSVHQGRCYGIAWSWDRRRPGRAG